MGTLQVGFLAWQRFDGRLTNTAAVKYLQPTPATPPANDGAKTVTRISLTLTKQALNRKGAETEARRGGGRTAMTSLSAAGCGRVSSSRIGDIS